MSAPDASDRPRASSESQAFHCGLLDRILGTWAGHRRARASVTGNSRVLGAPTALNQTGVPPVSKRIRLKVALALNCWNGPVRYKESGSSASVTHRLIFANQFF